MNSGMKMQQEKSAWRKVSVAKKFSNAFRGLRVVMATTRHFTVYIIALFVVIGLGFYFDVSTQEWISLVFAAGLVLVSEAFNTAIEIDIDLTSPDYHPYARDTKDVAAGAVLLASISSLVIGLIVFLPHILSALSTFPGLF